MNKSAEIRMTCNAAKANLQLGVIECALHETAAIACTEVVMDVAVKALIGITSPVSIGIGIVRGRIL